MPPVPQLADFDVELEAYKEHVKEEIAQEAAAAGIAALTRRKEIGYVGWEFDGGRVEANTEDNRLQIFFDEKPDKDIREELKGNGFRYAPSAEAWQRQLNDNAIYAADRIKCIQPITGERPTELQKRARQEAAAQKGAEPEQPQEAAQDTEPGDASTPETFCKVRQNPYSDSRENSYILQEYVTQDNGMAKLGDILYMGTPEKCRELLGKLEAGELTQGDVKELYAKAQEAQTTTEPGQETPEPTATEKEPDKDTFSIYQLKDGDGMRDYHFEPYDRLQAAGLSVEAANYELIYTAELTPGTSLEDIYTRFNIDHPADFSRTVVILPLFQSLQSPAPWQQLSVFPCRSCRPAMRQAAAAGYFSRWAAPKETDLRICCSAA